VDALPDTTDIKFIILPIFIKIPKNRKPIRNFNLILVFKFHITKNFDITAVYCQYRDLTVGWTTGVQFPAEASKLALGTTQPPIQRVSGFLPGDKAAGS
jgi:hypothetical protein